MESQLSLIADKRYNLTKLAGTELNFYRIHHYIDLHSALHSVQMNNPAERKKNYFWSTKQKYIEMIFHFTLLIPIYHHTKNCC